MENFNIQFIKQINKFVSSFSKVSTLDGMAQQIGKILDEIFNPKVSELYLFDKHTLERFMEFLIKERMIKGKINCDLNSIV